MEDKSFSICMRTTVLPKCKIRSQLSALLFTRFFFLVFFLWILFMVDHDLE